MIEQSEIVERLYAAADNDGTEASHLLREAAEAIENRDLLLTAMKSFIDNETDGGFEDTISDEVEEVYHTYFDDGRARGTTFGQLRRMGIGEDDDEIIDD